MSNEDKMREEFVNWFDSEPHRRKYHSDDPAMLAGYEAWKAATEACAAIKDAEIAELKMELKRQMDDATRLQRLATFCGVSCPETQEEKALLFEARIDELEKLARVNELEKLACDPKYGYSDARLLELKAKLAELN